MLKKFLFASSLLAITTGTVLANPAPYIGAGLGITTNTSSTNGKIHTSPSNFRGVPFNVLAGYGGVINQSFYLAGEAFATVGTATISSNYGSVRSSYGYGVSILPGVMLSDHTLAFARLGAVRTAFPTAKKTGGQLGLGLQTSVMQDIDIRGEYDYTAYSSISAISKPRSDAATLSLIYKIA